MTIVLSAAYLLSRPCDSYFSRYSCLSLSVPTVCESKDSVSRVPNKRDALDAFGLTRPGPSEIERTHGDKLNPDTFAPATEESNNWQCHLCIIETTRR